MKLAGKILDIFEKIMCILLGALMIIMLGTITLQVVSRYLFSAPPTWTEELARRLLQLIVFCGAGIGYRKSEMSGITLLVDHMSPRARKAAEIVTHIAIILFCGYLAWQGCLMCVQIGSQLSPALRMPKWPFMAAIPFFGVISIIFGIEKIIRVFMTEG